MGFSDEINRFTDKAKETIEAKKREVEENAKKVLKDLLGDDVSQIESIVLDADIGKFHSVVAPEGVLAKLREADLLKPAPPVNSDPTVGFLVTPPHGESK